MNEDHEANRMEAGGAMDGKAEKNADVPAAVAPPSVPLWRKLVPFALRARVVLVGRERIMQFRKRLAFLLITEDISENSRKEALRTFPCPVYQLLTMEQVQEVFGYHGTKMLGFKRSPLSNSIAADFRPYRVSPSLADEKGGGRSASSEET